MADLALVVVTHNSMEFLPGLAESWLAISKDLPRQQGVEVLVSDSASTDATAAWLSDHWPAARFLAGPNGGFGAAANRAVAAVQASWILLCNADLTFTADFGRHLLAPLLEGRLPPPVGGQTACVAPGLVNADGSAQASVGAFPTLHGAVADQFRPRPLRKYLRHQPAAPARIDWATAACLLFRRGALLRVGGFDERYFLYVEEVDLQRRLHDAGFNGVFLPAARVVHHAPNAARAPRPAAQRWAARGMQRYFALHGSLLQRVGFAAMAATTRRIPVREAFARRATVIARSTGP